MGPDDSADFLCVGTATLATADPESTANFATGIGNQVRVSASQPFTFLTPLVGELWGGQIDLDASATAPVLNPVSVTVLASPPGPTPSATPSPTPLQRQPVGARGVAGHRGRR